MLIDELPMTPDTLLGRFESNLTAAAIQNMFSKRADKSKRPLGGYNLLTFGDLFQIPPIPSSAALYIPLSAKTETSEKAKSLFWSEDVDGLNMCRSIFEEWFKNLPRQPQRLGLVVSSGWTGKVVVKSELARARFDQLGISILKGCTCKTAPKSERV